MLNVWFSYSKFKYISTFSLWFPYNLFILRDFLEKRSFGDTFFLNDILRLPCQNNFIVFIFIPILSDYFVFNLFNCVLIIFLTIEIVDKNLDIIDFLTTSSNPFISTKRNVCTTHVNHLWNHILREFGIWIIRILESIQFLWLSVFITINSSLDVIIHFLTVRFCECLIHNLTFQRSPSSLNFRSQTLSHFDFSFFFLKCVCF